MIRPYESSDLEDLLDAWSRASAVAHPFLDEEFLSVERTAIADRWLPASETLVFEVEGRVVGFLSLVGNEVGGLFVHPDHHRRGIGSALLDRARSMRSVLELSVFEDNPIGRAFYEGHGFAEVGRRMNEDAGHMEIRLRLLPGDSGG